MSGFIYHKALHFFSLKLIFSKGHFHFLLSLKHSNQFLLLLTASLYFNNNKSLSRKYEISEPGLHFHHVCHLLELACIIKLALSLPATSGYCSSDQT